MWLMSCPGDPEKIGEELRPKRGDSDQQPKSEEVSKRGKRKRAESKVEVATKGLGGRK